MADYSKFEALNVQILGISSNIPFSQKTFADSLKLPYPLLSDAPDLKVIRSYGGLNPDWDMTTAQRWFFLIDLQGIVRRAVARIDKRSISERADPESGAGACAEAVSAISKRYTCK